MTAQPRVRLFGEFAFDPASGELMRDGRIIPLEYQPSLVLGRLLDSPGEVVTRQELAALLWSGTHVKFDDGLNYCIRQLRAALGDDPRSPRFIETIPRRGYRFITPVAEARPAARRHVRLAIPLAVAGVIVLGIVLESRPNRHHEIAVSVARAVHDLVF